MDNLRDLVDRVLVEDLEVAPDQLTDTATLAALELDSLAITELVVVVKENTGVDLGELESTLGELTLPQLVALVREKDGERTA
ncbi:acyl carrier protein [Streptomyces sp. WM6386]|uniref:acyl carrier protein n=1 Tax=Streptomyces sp. WM6386 TaxID=1415558 RepID=UPI000619E366|nr:acyl carrier protein [Streptomyces sp. WM6386]KKD03477.1 hypothetical protein TN53_34945 [Streptomyces sp. WM6386]